MSDTAIKQRQARAKRTAMDLLSRDGWDIIKSDNARVCVIGMRSTEIRLVRIVIDKIVASDEQALVAMKCPDIPQVVRELWVFSGNTFHIVPCGKR